MPAERKKRLETLLAASSEDTADQFESYLRAIQTARSNIEHFQKQESMLARHRSLQQYFKYLKAEDTKESLPDINNQLDGPPATFAEFFRTTTAQKSRNVESLQRRNLTTGNTLYARSTQRVIAVYSSQSARRVTNKVGVILSIIKWHRRYSLKGQFRSCTSYSRAEGPNTTKVLTITMILI